MMQLPHARLLLQFIRGRWMMAVASFYILSCSGATYIFGIYSNTIKTQLHYNQETLDTLSFFKDIGANVGLISGVMTEVLPPWIVLIVGSFMNLFGYLMIWLAVTHRIARPPTWQMYLFICVGANSQTFANTGVMVTFVKNFPHGRGEVLGIIKGCVGLSAAILTQLYHALYGEDARGAILLIAVVPSLVTCIFMLFIRILRPVYDALEKRNFYSFLYLALLIAAFLSLAIIVENVERVPLWGYKAFGAMSVMLVVLNTVIGVRAEYSYMKQVRRMASEAKDNMLQEFSTTKDNYMGEAGLGATSKDKISSSFHHEKAKKHAQELHEGKLHNLGTTMPLVSRVEVAHKNLSSKHTTSPFGSADFSKKPKFLTKLKLFFSDWPQRGDDFTIVQALFSMDLWLLFLAVSCGVGAVLTAVDNMGQIGESLGYSAENISTFVSLLSIWNFLGRVGAGFGSEILLRRYRWPRTFILTVVTAMACSGHLLIAFPAANTLYIASIILGFCFGAQISLFFAIMSELFGLKYYAFLQSLGGITSPLGTYLLNVRVAGHLYDQEAHRQHGEVPGTMNGDLKCMGHECFRLSFLIMTIVTAFGTLVSCLLTARTKNFYSQDIYSKFHIKPDNTDNQCEIGH